MEKVFTKNVKYDIYETNLIEQIIAFIKKIKYSKNPFAKILASFSEKYKIFPVESNSFFVNLDNFLEKGSYGSVFKQNIELQNCKFDVITKVNIPEVIKGKIDFDTDNIREAFLNYVAVNSILMKMPNLNLVPTFGIFICEHEYKETKKDNKTHYKLLSICKGNNMDGLPNIHLVQQQIKGKELADVINNFSLFELKIIIYQIFHTLVELENSPYKIYHTDLHSGNILIDENNCPFIIDFGLSSFTLNNHRYRSRNSEKNYSEKTHICSGLYDLAELMNSIRKRSRDKNVIEYTTNILKKVFNMLLKDIDTPLTYKDSDHIFLYTKLIRAEKKIKDKEIQKIVHRHNVTVLNKMTYKQCISIL
jgi:hypothetical protein